MYYHSTELYHHGIKGQKWGVRRYQNEDGTLTSAGQKRYRSDTGGDKSPIQQYKADALRRVGDALFDSSNSKYKHLNALPVTQKMAVLKLMSNYINTASNQSDYTNFTNRRGEVYHEAEKMVYSWPDRATYALKPGGTAVSNIELHNLINDIYPQVRAMLVYNEGEQKNREISEMARIGKTYNHAVVADEDDDDDDKKRKTEKIRNASKTELLLRQGANDAKEILSNIGGRATSALKAVGNDIKDFVSNIFKKKPILVTSSVSMTVNQGLGDTLHWTSQWYIDEHGNRIG